MTSSIKIIAAICATSALISIAPTYTAIAQDEYAGCSCVTAPGSFRGGVGQIVSVRGEVLVNNLGASSGQILPASSEIMVGSGSAAYSVGATCTYDASANTVAMISQPGGPGSDLCVRISALDYQVPEFEGAGPNAGPNTGLLIGGLAIGAGGVLALALGGDNDRAPASP